MNIRDMLIHPLRTARGEQPDGGQTARATTLGAWERIGGGSSLPALTEHTARQVPIVGAMLTAISNTFVSLDVQARGPTARRVLAVQPSANWTAPALWGWAAGEALLTGRALVEIERRQTGSGRLLHALYPVTGDGRSIYAPTGRGLDNSQYRVVRIGETTPRVVSVADVLELTTAVPPRGLMDSPGARAVALLKLMDDALTGVIDGGFLVRFLLIASRAFRDKQLEGIAERFAKSYSRGVGGAAVPIAIDGAGDGGMQVEQLTPDLRAAQVDEITRTLERRVLVHCGFPAEYSAKSAELKDLRLVYRLVARPIAVLFAAEVRRKTGIVMEFNPRTLLRGDPGERRQMYTAALGAPGKPGWLTQNEVRAEEGLTPHSDERADQLNFGDQQPVDAPGQSDDGDDADDDAGDNDE